MWQPHCIFSCFLKMQSSGRFSHWSQHGWLQPSGFSLNSFAQRGLAWWPNLKYLLSHSSSYHTSLILCTALAIWYFWEQKSWLLITISLVIYKSMFLLLVTIFIHLEYFSGFLPLLTKKSHTLQISKLLLPKVTQVTMIELGFKLKTADSTAWPLKIYLSTYSNLDFP